MHKVFVFFRKNLVSMFIMGIRVLMMASKFALAVFIARFMGLDTLGLYSLLSSAVAVLPVLYRAGMQNILTREAVTQSPEALARNLYHYGAALLGIYTLTLPIVVAGGFIFGHLSIALLVFALVVIEHIVIDCFFLLLSLKRAIRANFMLFAQAGGWMLTFMLCAFFLPELRTLQALLLFWVGGGLIAILSAIGVWLDFPWRSVVLQGIDRSWYRMQWRTSRYFYGSDIANALGSNIDRYIVGLFLGLEMTGVYVFFWQMANAVYTLVNTGIIQLYRPGLIETYKKQCHADFYSLYWQSLKKVLAAAAVLSFSIAIIAPFVSGLTDKPLALSYIPVLWILLCSLCLRALADDAGIALLARHLDRQLISSNLIYLGGIALFVCVATYLFGVYGSASGLLLSSALLFAYRQYAVTRKET